LKFKIKYQPGFKFLDPLGQEYVVDEIRWRGDPHPVQYVVYPSMSLTDRPLLVEEREIDDVILHRQFLPSSKL
jgi:hypothetical protein